MTRVVRLFPHLPEPDLRPVTGRGPDPQIGRRDPLSGAPRPVSSPPDVKAPKGLPLVGTPAADRASLQQLTRLLTSLETSPAVSEQIRNMPGMDVLRQHLQMQCALEGLLRGLIKE